MNTPLSWIKAYVPDLDVSDQEYTDAMTLSGTKVEGFERLDKNLEKIVVGRIDRIERHPDVADNYKIGERTYVAVIDMPSMIPFTTFDRKYTGIAKYPAVSRDISMVVPKDVLVGQIEDVIEQRGGKLLESYQLFDIYEGAQILAGFKSVAYSITFRAKDHTLEDKEVGAVMNKILNGLQALGIELRA